MTITLADEQGVSFVEALYLFGKGNEWKLRKTKFPQQNSW